MNETEEKPPWAGDRVIDTDRNRQQVDSRFNRSEWKMSSHGNSPAFHAGVNPMRALPMSVIPELKPTLAEIRRDPR